MRRWRFPRFWRAPATEAVPGANIMPEADRLEMRLHAVVSGGVQGVGFRFFARAQARALGLRGYVRNEPGGSVEVVAEGPRPALEQLLGALRRGPAAAEVTDVAVSWQPAEQTFSDFAIRH